jgi:hypothetical protein
MTPQDCRACRTPSSYTTSRQSALLNPTIQENTLISIIRNTSLHNSKNFNPRPTPADPTSAMCVTIYGRRECAICGFIPDELIHMPYDRRARTCEMQGLYHQQRSLYNNSPFVCACCIELVHVGLERGFIVIRGMKLNPEAKEFVPWWVWKGKKLGWFGDFWYME